MGSISIREHIKWGAEPPSEPTSTLVLTSPRRYFVDIRILKEALEPLEESTTSAAAAPHQGRTLGRDQIDWAIGGTSASTTPIGTGSQPPAVSHSTFRHWVDSRTRAPETVVDEGDMAPGPLEGTTLETGSMVNPATGAETAYEELWRDEEPQPVSGQPGWCRSCVFRLHDDARHVRGLFVQLGQHAQGVLRVGDAFTAERWRWSISSSRWERVCKAGNEKSQSLAGLLDEAGKKHDEGDTIETAAGPWKVIEAYH